jgi:hypothetical protein
MIIKKYQFFVKTGYKFLFTGSILIALNRAIFIINEALNRSLFNNLMPFLHKAGFVLLIISIQLILFEIKTFQKYILQGLSLIFSLPLIGLLFNINPLNKAVFGIQQLPLFFLSIIIAFGGLLFTGNNVKKEFLIHLIIIATIFFLISTFNIPNINGKNSYYSITFLIFSIISSLSHKILVYKGECNG